MALSHTQLVKLEQLGAIEAGGHTLPQVSDAHRRFEEWLSARLNTSEQTPTLHQALTEAVKVFRAVKLGLALLFGFLGVATATQLLVSPTGELNVFALLGSMLGIHTLSLLLWCGLMLLPHRQAPSLLQWITAPLVRWAVSLSTHSLAHTANLAWHQAQFAAPFRIWRLGFLTHWCWLFFLLGNGMGLLLLFTTRSYNFVWESTLFEADAFSALMQPLITPLTLIQWPTPEITASLSTVDAALPDKRRWAIFIMGCLLWYGALPRFAAMILCVMATRWHESRHTFEPTKAPFLQWQARFDAQLVRTQILDPDPAVKATSKLSSLSFSTQAPPENGRWLGLEIGETSRWLSVIPKLEAAINQPDDIQTILAKPSPSHAPTIVFVDGKRSPDRGTQRLLNQCAAHASWFAVVDTDHTPSTKQQAWLQAAKQAGFTPDKWLYVQAPR